MTWNSSCIVCDTSLSVLRPIEQSETLWKVFCQQFDLDIDWRNTRREIKSKICSSFCDTCCFELEEIDLMMMRIRCHIAKLSTTVVKVFTNRSRNLHEENSFDNESPSKSAEEHHGTRQERQKEREKIDKAVVKRIRKLRETIYKRLQPRLVLTDCTSNSSLIKPTIDSSAIKKENVEEEEEEEEEISFPFDDGGSPFQECALDLDNVENVVNDEVTESENIKVKPKRRWKPAVKNPKRRRQRSKVRRTFRPNIRKVNKFSYKNFPFEKTKGSQRTQYSCGTCSVKRPQLTVMIAHIKHVHMGVVPEKEKEKERTAPGKLGLPTYIPTKVLDENTFSYAGFPFEKIDTEDGPRFRCGTCQKLATKRRHIAEHIRWTHLLTKAVTEVSTGGENTEQPPNLIPESTLPESIDTELVIDPPFLTQETIIEEVPGDLEHEDGNIFMIPDQQVNSEQLESIESDIVTSILDQSQTVDDDDNLSKSESTIIDSTIPPEIMELTVNHSSRRISKRKRKSLLRVKISKCVEPKETEETDPDYNEVESSDNDFEPYKKMKKDVLDDVDDEEIEDERLQVVHLDANHFSSADGKYLLEKIQTEEGNSMFKCGTCDHQVVHMYSMKRHITNKHIHKFVPEVEDDDGIADETCPFRVVHLEGNHFSTRDGKYLFDKIQTEEGDSMFKCGTCDHQVHHMHSMKRHITSKHKRKNKEDRPTETLIDNVNSVEESVEEPIEIDVLEVVDDDGIEDERYPLQVVRLDANHFSSEDGKYLFEKIQTEEGNSMFKCGTCDHQVVHMHSMKRHITSKHIQKRPDKDLFEKIQTEEGNSMFKCGICDHQVVHMRSMKRHMKSKHKEKAQLPPLDKSILPKLPNIIKIKDRSRLKPPPKSKDPEDVAIELEDGRFLYKEILYFDRVEYGLRCLTCNWIFADTKKMTSHLNKVHVPGPYTCTVCQKICPSQAILDRHRCNMKKPYQSLHLGNGQFLYDGQWKYSTLDGMWTCGHCVYHNTRRDGLHLHIQDKHAFGKQYQCEECGKSFFKKQAFEHHVATHSEARPWLCPDCGKTFKTDHDLNKHQRLTHQELKFQCYICEKFMKTEIGLKQHKHFHTLKLEKTGNSSLKRVQRKGGTKRKPQQKEDDDDEEEDFGDMSESE